MGLESDSLHNGDSLVINGLEQKPQAVPHPVVQNADKLMAISRVHLAHYYLVGFLKTAFKCDDFSSLTC